MSFELVPAAADLAEMLTDTLDNGELTYEVTGQWPVHRISYLDVLDALASLGLTLTPSTGKEASHAHIASAELEQLVNERTRV